ncbi:MAG: ATP-dependent DNA helicase RecG [Clostridia bacterium]|nr:ATP-dependent DNA helicase RecG [Clostridia bacterium]
MERLTESSPVRALPGVGESRAAAFARMGIYTLRDLIRHFPRAYENRGAIRRLSEGLDGEASAFLLTVATEPRGAMIRRGMTITKFRAFDESGTVEVVFFNQNYVKDIFHTGAQFRFFGKLTPTRSGFQLASPAYEAVVPGIPLPPFVAKYPLTEGISSKLVEKTVLAALRAVLPSLVDYLPEDIRCKHGFPTLSYALMSIHAPRDHAALTAALRRVVFDELYCFSLGMALSRARRTTADSPICPKADLTPLLSRLPYSLTAAQNRVCEEILADMAGGKQQPMNRILIGDVGCGKTICAAVAIYNVVRAGHQAALMVPTEILAHQHYNELSALLSPLGIRVALLLGSTPEREKKQIRAAAEATDDSRVDLLIGTHALLSDKLQFSALGLTVTDEQHRFGVRQRAALKQKQRTSHLLVMSATPIPRTMALTLYGDLDVSRIDEMPPGRQRVATYVVNEGYRERLHGFMRRQVAEGGQVYVVCPAVEETEEEENDLPLDRLDLLAAREERPPLKAATAYAAQLQNEVFPDLRVEFLHGRMKAAEKDDVMRRFAAGEVDILVSTTVIEVGVNVPRASLMVVENAERFGLSQLHQLRGRVGRGVKKSYCVLVSDATGESARARLEVMRTTYDGYRIAEKDLEQRGPGDFFAAACAGGFRQSGGMSLHLSYLCSDTDLMHSAAEEAKSTAAIDPTLSLPAHTALRAEVERLFAIEEATIS